LILLPPVVIKLSHLNLGEAYVAMIVTMPSMKNVFQNTISSTFPFLKMEMNSCHVLQESSTPSNEKLEEEEGDYDEYDDDDDIDELFSLANKQK
jgi:hypothetical protein